LTPQERGALLRAVEADNDPQHILIMRLGLDGGLRASEMTGLLGTDVIVSARKGVLNVRGKGRKYRVVPMTPALKEAFKAHRCARYVGKPVRVLVGRRGPLTIRGCQDIANRYAGRARVPGKKQAGIPDFSIHTLRHTAAWWMLNHPRPEKRLNPFEVAQIMGHSDVKVTMQYARSHSEQLIERVTNLDD
jgi:integrase